MKISGSHMTPRLMRMLKKTAVAAWVLVSMACLFTGYPADLMPARAAQPGGELSATLDRTRAQVGDVVRLNLNYRLPEGASLSTPLKVEGIEGMTELERHTTPEQIQIKLFVDRLDTWRSGPLVLYFKDRGGKMRTLTTGPVSLTVDSGIEEKAVDAELRPIQDIIPARRFWSSFWPWIAAVSAVAGGLLVIWWLRKRKGRNLPRERIGPPHIIAQKAIEALARDRLFEKGEVKRFYFIFSEILRRYLAAIRHFPATEYTVEEIARKIEIDEDRKLLTLLRQADLVKFANAVPTPARKEEDLCLALAYIRDTAPVLDDGNRSNTYHETLGDPS